MRRRSVMVWCTALSLMVAVASPVAGQTEPLVVPQPVREAVQRLAGKGARVQIGSRFEVIDVTFFGPQLRNNGQVTIADIEALAALPDLKQVSLQRVGIDAEAIALLSRLTELDRLVLERVDGVSDEQVAELRKSLPRCDLVVMSSGSRNPERGSTSRGLIGRGSNGRGRGGLVLRSRGFGAQNDIRQWLPEALQANEEARPIRKIANGLVQFELELTSGQRRQVRELVEAGPSSARSMFRYRGQIDAAADDEQREKLRDEWTRALADEQQSLQSILSERQWSRLVELEWDGLADLPSAQVRKDSLLAFLMTGSAREDLKLSEQQQQVLNELLSRSPHRTDAERRFREQLAATRSLQQRASLVTARFQSERAEDVEIRELLTPEQHQAVQRRLWRFEGEQSLTRPEVVAALQLSNEQIGRLEQLKQEIAAGQPIAPDAFLDVLTTDQRQRWESMLSDHKAD